ncbi:MAG: sugar phosphate isomerase/epimerase family protein [Clostridia bacterium]
MNEIKIGTLIPGQFAFDWIDPMIDLGFETLEINFHMKLCEGDLNEYAKKVMDKIDGRVSVNTFGLYCNPIQRENDIIELKKCIDVAHIFDTNIISTFAGAYNGQPVEDSMVKFKEVFTEITKYAADKGVTIALENCPMGGSWQSAKENIAFNARAWEMMFEQVPADNLGLEWEPAHQMGQLIDPINNLKNWVHKIVHIHGKDATIDKEAIRDFGVNGAKQFAYMRTPGFGDTNWRDIFFTLYQNGYKGNLCVEGYHDPIYCKDWETTGQIHALNYLKWARGGNFTANPWAK